MAEGEKSPEMAQAADPGKSADDSNDARCIGRQAFGRSWPEFDEALRLNSVSWEHVASAFFWSDIKSRPIPDAEIFGEYYKKLSRSFFNAHGGPEESYIAWDPQSYVVVTTQGELHVSVNSAISNVTEETESAYKRVVQLIGDVQRLDHKSSLLMGRTGRSSPGWTSWPKRRARLQGRSVRATVTEDLYLVLAYSIQILELMQRGEHRAYEQLVDIQERAFEATRERFQQAVRRRAALYYLLGMLIALPFVFTLLPRLIGQLEQPGVTADLLSATMVMGIVGAFVSVMIRLSRSRLRFRNDAVRWEIALLGGLRVLLGLVFGLVMFVLITSRLFPLEVPTDPVDRKWLFSALGFISGFSETLIPDQLVPTTSTLRALPRSEADETESK